MPDEKMPVHPVEMAENFTKAIKSSGIKFTWENANKRFVSNEISDAKAHAFGKVFDVPTLNTRGILLTAEAVKDKPGTKIISFDADRFGKEVMENLIKNSDRVLEELKDGEVKKLARDATRSNAPGSTVPTVKPRATGNLSRE